MVSAKQIVRVVVCAATATLTNAANVDTIIVRTMIGKGRTEALSRLHNVDDSQTWSDVVDQACGLPRPNRKCGFATKVELCLLDNDHHVCTTTPLDQTQQISVALQGHQRRTILKIGIQFTGEALVIIPPRGSIKILTMDGTPSVPVFRTSSNGEWRAKNIVRKPKQPLLERTTTAETEQMMSGDSEEVLTLDADLWPVEVFEDLQEALANLSYTTGDDPNRAWVMQFFSKHESRQREADAARRREREAAEEEEREREAARRREREAAAARRRGRGLMMQACVTGGLDALSCFYQNNFNVDRSIRALGQLYE